MNWIWPSIKVNVCLKAMIASLDLAVVAEEVAVGAVVAADRADVVVARAVTVTRAARRLV